MKWINSVGNKAAIAACLLVAVALSGCKNVPAKNTDTVSGANPELLNSLMKRTDWSVRGSLGIWTEKSAQTTEQNITASMLWSEQGEQLEVLLRGPLGVGELLWQPTLQGPSCAAGRPFVKG